MQDLRVPLGPILDAFGVPATVTRPIPDDAAIVTTGVWLKPLDEPAPVGRDFQRREPRRVLLLPRVDVPTLPRGTVVEAPEVKNGPVKTWRVDGFDQAVEPDAWRAVMALAGN